MGTFNREMFRAAAASTVNNNRSKWRPDEEGDYICEVVQFKESWGKNGNYFIPELKVLMAPEGVEGTEGKEFGLFVNLTEDDPTKQIKDYARIKSYVAAAMGLRGDEEGADDIIDDAYESYLSERAKLVFKKGGKFEKETEELEGLAEGAIVGVRVKKNAAKPDDNGKYRKNQLDDDGEPKVFTNYYPFLVELEEGYEVDPGEPSKAIGPGGVAVKRESVVKAA